MYIYVYLHTAVFKCSEKRFIRHGYPHACRLIFICAAAKVVVIQHHTHLCYTNLFGKFCNPCILRIIKTDLHTHMLVYQIIAFVSDIRKFRTAVTVKLFCRVTCLNIHTVNSVFVNLEFMRNLLFTERLDAYRIMSRINVCTVFVTNCPFNVKIISAIRT